MVAMISGGESTQAVRPYLGTKPSKALELAPFVEASIAIRGVLDIIYGWFNLHGAGLLQARSRHLTPATQIAVVNNIQYLRMVSVIIQIEFWPLLILAVYWGAKRRSRTAVRIQGELYVGTPYRQISSRLSTTYCVLLAAIFALIPFSSAHSGATIQQLITVRRFLALGALPRTALAVVAIELVRRAVKDQRYRESLPVSETPELAFGPPGGPPRTPTSPELRSLAKCQNCGAARKIGVVRCPSCGTDRPW